MTRDWKQGWASRNAAINELREKDIARLREKMTSEIIWTGSPDDQTARIGDYILRVELMDDYWWWAFYFEEEEYHGGEHTVERAKTACEKAYYEHLKTEK